MAGKPGKSGGARKGCGRKPKVKAQKPPIVPIDGDDTLKLLQDIAFGRVESSSIQVRAAIAAVQYTHTKRGDGGVKEGRNEAAKKAVSRFAPAAPPKLVAAGGKKI